MIEITLELLIQHLGQPDKHQGAYYKWQCPFAGILAGII